MEKILVTGATSFIGRYLIEKLKKHSDIELHALVRPNSPNFQYFKDNDMIKVVPVDIANTNMLRQYIENVDVCYHLAWNGTRGEYRHDDELQASNYVNSIELYKNVKSLGCKVFIGIGSQAEYGLCNEPITEDTPTVPNTAYGKWKLATGQKLVELGNRDSIRVVWGRVFSIYGKGDYENTLIMSAIKKMRSNEPIDMTEGTQYWNYLYVEDLAKILVSVKGNAKAYGVYNLASDDTRMLKEYILDLKSILNSDSKINFGSVPYSAGGKVNLIPNIEKIKLCVPNIRFQRFGKIVEEMVDD